MKLQLKSGAELKRDAATSCYALATGFAVSAIIVDDNTWQLVAVVAFLLFGLWAHWRWGRTYRPPGETATNGLVIKYTTVWEEDMGSRVQITAWYVMAGDEPYAGPFRTLQDARRHTQNWVRTEMQRGDNG